jgi:hypothetical protein
MRYEMLRLAQLVFALSLMFGAFLGGIAVGWLRWGRQRADEADEIRLVPPPQPVVPRLVKHDLFSPDVDGHAAVDLTIPPFSPAELAPSSGDAAPGVPR